MIPLYTTTEHPFLMATTTGTASLAVSPFQFCAIWKWRRIPLKCHRSLMSIGNCRRGMDK